MQCHTAAHLLLSDVYLLYTSATGIQIDYDDR